MNDRTIFRLQDIVGAIEQIGILLDGKSFADLQSDRILRAAFERVLETQRSVKTHSAGVERWRSNTPWRRIGDIGNHLRHAYHRVDAEILWSLHKNGDLANLRQVVAGFIETVKAGNRP